MSEVKSAKVTKGNTKAFSQSRNWCFTDFELLDISGIYHTYSDIIRYIGYGEEICPKTKTKHFQGWIQFINKKRIGGVKRIFGTKKIHLETCRGSELENKNYCAKDGKFQQFGSYTVQGQRTDLENIKKKIDNGSDLKEIADNYFGDFIRYHSGLKAYKQLVDKEKTKKFRKVEVKVISGPTGCGKTKEACKGEYYKIEGSNLKWWDGYNMEKKLVIDEYDNDIKITKLLNILDGYQLRLDVKGSFTYANWEHVIITTNLKKEQFHNMAKEEHRNALWRRITKWVDKYES